MEEALKDTILNYLKGHNTMTLATSGEGGPWAASVFYANDGFTLYFLSEPTSRHSVDIEKNQMVAVTINEDYKDWREIQGIQLYGHAGRVGSRRERAKALTLYRAKYPFVGKMLLSPKIARAIARVKFYKVVPRWIRFIDNRVEFGHKKEMTLE